MTRAALNLICSVLFCVPVFAAGAQEVTATDGPSRVIVHVATSGSNSNPGTEDRPYRTIQYAVDRAVTGTKILVHAGTYPEVVEISTRSGSLGLKNVLREAGDGEVIIRPRLPVVSCSATAPTRDRAIRILNGVDNWRIRGLTIYGGILVSGRTDRSLEAYVTDRTLPGRGLYDPVAAERTLPLLGADPADNVDIWRNKIMGRGLYVFQARKGTILNNEVGNIDCGTGGGITIGRFSDFWNVRYNWVHNVTEGTEPFMAWGIRLNGASMYNLVELNTVEDVDGHGRGICADVHAGWNVIQQNTVRRAATGFNDQMGGWGNEWLGNVSESNRSAGFAIMTMGNDLTRPNDSVPAYLKVRCFRSTSTPSDLVIGAVQASEFERNAFPNVKLFRNVESYWGSAGNTWDGSSRPPSESPPQMTC